MFKLRRRYQQSGFGLIEVLVATGILSLVILGVMGIASTMSDMQSRMSQKFDQMTLASEARSLMEDAQLCGPSFDGQIDSAPLQGQYRDLPYLKWGSTATRFLEVGTTSPTLKVKPTRIRVTVDTASPTQFQQADLNTAGHPVITINKYAATLRIEMEATTNPNQGPGFRATQIPFSILRRNGTNQFIGCHTDYSPAQLCEDEFGGTYDATAVPHCQLTHLGISAPYPTGNTLLDVGTASTVTNYTGQSVANINGNLTVGSALRIGTDNRTWFARNATGIPRPYDLTLYVNTVPGAGTYGGVFRFDDNGVINALGGYAFNNGGSGLHGEQISAASQATGLYGNWSSALPNDIVMSFQGAPTFRFNEKGILNAAAGYQFNNGGMGTYGQDANATSSRATAFFGNWSPSFPNDVVLTFLGTPRFRFSEKGQINAASGYQFNNAGSGVVTSSAELSSMGATGLFSFFDGAILDDIGVFIRGNGLFRFHIDGNSGDFFVQRNIDAGGSIHSSGDIRTDSNVRAAGVVQSSDERLKSNIKPLENSLEKITHLHGVSFVWNQSTPLKGQHSIGLIAQNVASEYPELVKRDEKGYFTVAYTSLIAAVIEAIKELKNLVFSRTNALQEVISRQQLEIQNLKARLDQIEKRLAQEH